MLCSDFSIYTMNFYLQLLNFEAALPARHEFLIEYFSEIFKLYIVPV
jgi:hypothetical protein